MKRVGIISDTHDVLRCEVKEILKGCDAVIHGGDITTEEVLEEIRRLGNVYVVRGNNDWRFSEKLQKSLRFEIEGVRFFLTHDKRDVSRRLEDVDVVIFGHSHKYYQETIDGRLWLNPGACGRPRFGLGLTMAVMEIEEGQFQVEKISLDSVKKRLFEDPRKGILR